MESAASVKLIRCPYRAGETLNVRTIGDGEVIRDLQLRIIDTYTPFSMACVMQVDVLQRVNEPWRAVLKLSDRRFAERHRESWEVGPLNEDIEKKYREFVRCDRGWNDAQKEVSLHERSMDMYEAETAVYDTMRENEGKEIPRLFAKVVLDNELLEIATTDVCHGITDQPPPWQEIAITAIKESATESSIEETELVAPDNEDIEKTESRELEEAHGMLMEYVDGFTLAETEANAPQHAWQDIVDQAIQNIHVMSNYEILDADISELNILVMPNSAYESGFRVVSIDFGQSRFREKDESDSDWGRSKFASDEEGATQVREALYVEGA